MKDSKYQGQRAISYARASMGKGRGQEDSTDRQIDETREYCERYGLVLDTSYSLVDEGVSAFRQVKGKDGRMIAKNLHESSLAKFTEEVTKGAFPDGIHFIVEKLDRMYRDDPERALEHMLVLKRHGVTIHTTMDNQIFDPNDKENKQTQLLISVIKLCASHEYSKALSQRQLKSRERRLNKMKKGEVYFEPLGTTKKWVEKVIDPDTGQKKPYVSDEWRVIITQIFKAYAEDGKSGRQIARQLNEDGVKTPYGHSWLPSTITELIKDRSVLGWLHITKDDVFHYPEVEIISKELFQQANDLLASKIQRKGRKSEDHHIFDGLMVCGYCLSQRKKKNESTFGDTTLRYSRDVKYNPQDAGKVLRPYTSYRCSRGQEDSRNCNGYRLDYYQFHETFFSFVKDLDFSSLIDNSDNEKLEHQSLMLSLKSDIDAKKKEKYKFEKLLDRFEDDEDMFNEYADKIKEANSELKELQIEYENAKSNFDSRQLAKSEVKGNEKEIKKLLDQAHNHHEWIAYQTLRLDLEDKKYSTGKYVGKNISKADQEKFDDIWKLSLMGEDQKEEADKIRYKYFADEIEKDEQALEVRMRLNALLKKFIKKIEYHPFGFRFLGKTKPFEFREKSECSCSDEIKKDLNEYLESNNLIDTSRPNLNPKKWTGAKIMEVLKIGSNSTLENWFKQGMPDPRKTGVSIQDTILWKKKRDMKGHVTSNSKATKHLNSMYKRFRGFSIEFTDICKPDTIKYVVPYWKDNNQGVCYNYNIKERSVSFDFAFGKAERNEMMHRPDKYFIKALSMMDDHLDSCAEDHITKYTSNIPAHVLGMAMKVSGSDEEEIHMIPHSWKELSSDEIIPLIKKHKMHTHQEHHKISEKVAKKQNKKTKEGIFMQDMTEALHPIIQEDKSEWIKNKKGVYQHLWFWGCETPQHIKDGISKKQFEKESQERLQQAIQKLNKK